MILIIIVIKIVAIIKQLYFVPKMFLQWGVIVNDYNVVLARNVIR